ncbi:MAG TPA: hydroxymethylbilane synthase [Longimicrobiales bacterium]
MTLRLGSRGSRLALWQAEHVKRRLEAAHPGLQVEIRILRTTGDRITDVPLARIGDKGLFTKEIDRAVASGEVDAAVHSLKDVPTRLAERLALAAVLEREDPRDVYIPGAERARTLEGLPAGATVGTSSLRRRAQLLHLRPDLRVEDLRGNLDTRLERLREGRYDAIILAHAGIRRLGFDAAVGQLLEPPGWLPAVGQGALGIVIREDDDATRALLAPLDHPETAAATTAERAFLRTLEGGCQIPIGALATLGDGRLHLHGFVAAIDGRPLLRADARGPAEDAEAVGIALAQRLLDEGAGEILAGIRGLDTSALPRASAP